MNRIIIISIISVLLVVAIGITVYFTVFHKPKNPPHPDPHTNQPFVFKITGEDCLYDDNYYQGKDAPKYDLHTYYSKTGNIVIRPYNTTLFNVCTINQKCGTYDRKGYFGVDASKKSPVAGSILEGKCTLTYLS